MKAIFTVLFVLFYGFAALANTNNQPNLENPKIENHGEVKFSQMGSDLDSGIIVVTSYNEIETTSKNDVTRLYKFKNSRIKKALAFSTKRNKAKIA
jgi:hypothetical protein